jgi:hypothetical protein
LPLVDVSGGSGLGQRNGDPTRRQRGIELLRERLNLLLADLLASRRRWLASDVDTVLIDGDRDASQRRADKGRRDLALAVALVSGRQRLEGNT